MIPLRRGPVPTGPEVWSRGWRRSFLLAVWALWVAWAVCQLLRDRWVVSTPFFYLPAPVMMGGLLALAMVVRFTGGRKISSLLLLLAILPAAIVRSDSLPRARKATPPVGPPVRMVHWNVCRGCLGWDRQVEQLRVQDADLYVLSEAPREVSPRALAAQFGDGYTGTRSGGLLVLVRGDLLAAQAIPAPRNLKLLGVRCRLFGDPVDVLVVDVVADPLVRRDPLLRAVVEQIGRWQPDLVVGDFNSPRRSRAFDRLPRGWGDAWDRAGSGWPYSWPVPVAVFALDHTLVGPRLQARSYALLGKVASDHRMQRFDFAVR